MFLSEEPCLDISAITFASQVIYISGLQMGHSFAGPARIPGLKFSARPEVSHDSQILEENFRKNK